MIEIKLRTRIPQKELDGKIGKILGEEDFNAVLTGPTKVIKANGQPLCVYLPGALLEHADNKEIYQALHSLRSVRTDNRGMASGSARVKETTGTSTRALLVPSSIIGSMDSAGRQKYCRLTAWTGQNLPQWQSLRPLLQEIARQMKKHVPDRYEAQMKEVNSTHKEWVVPGTPFTTVTVNNSYPTGVHQDAGDLDAGFSTLACLRKGRYQGGNLVFPRYRVALDMRHGDLALIDAHEWHGNTPIICSCPKTLNGLCPTCGAERISVVSYFRTNMTKCGTAEQEFAKAASQADARTLKRLAAEIDKKETPQ